MLVVSVRWWLLAPFVGNVWAPLKELFGEIVQTSALELVNVVILAGRKKQEVLQAEAAQTTIIITIIGVFPLIIQVNILVQRCTTKQNREARTTLSPAWARGA